MIQLTLLALVLLASALSAGFFYAFQWIVMPGLTAADPLAAIDAMQSINQVVRNPVFAFSFFGTLLFSVVAGLAFGREWRAPGGALLWAGVLIYSLGVVAVTFACNIPLNERLEAVTPNAETAAAVWRDFYAPWSFWNLIRALAAIGAFMCFSGAGFLLVRAPRL